MAPASAWHSLDAEPSDQRPQHAEHGLDALQRQELVRLVRLGDVAGAEHDRIHAELR
jgi:hypothetical protein